MLGMPHSRRWNKLLADSHGRQAASTIMLNAQGEYQQLMAVVPSIPARTHALRNCLKTRIYPGLALYRALLEDSPDTAQTLNLVERLLRADFFSGISRGIRLMNSLPDPFPLIRPVLKMMTRQQYLPGSQMVIEDSPDCFAINTTHCFTLDVLTALNARELTTLYCKTDDWLSEALPKVHWLRTKTLARGDKLCDFRWCRYV
ncbi:MAG: hypothetical protein A2X25_08465 [Chloroflexi bacterium GWB2_49_20]|nr:MAG: hypothetical protein A2X25_08465 [Chloroflexi bacterium GWB2_49_20]OGN79532.1 MAG: hypothetical protein A2X26_05560 [Chloroflexi bacterium GWC2_49_37]OGN84545.1 MAG: hypothetical protein A2X27_10970 [Chloroflexi bacterium GWD2_49_16]HBG74031.1 hypothetical protein [Anaerolineae bacterium]HCC78833.1 hypothetical protein [Anaerolineae bacterium]